MLLTSMNLKKRNVNTKICTEFLTTHKEIILKCWSIAWSKVSFPGKRKKNPFRSLFLCLIYSHRPQFDVARWCNKRVEKKKEGWLKNGEVNKKCKIRFAILESANLDWNEVGTCDPLNFFLTNSLLATYLNTDDGNVQQYVRINFKITPTHWTYFPFSQMLIARDNNWYSASCDSSLAVCRNFVNTSMKSRWMSGKPSLHICLSSSRDALISLCVGFGVG